MKVVKVYMERYNIEIGLEQFCLECKKRGREYKMRLDTINSYYVCIMCGWCVSSGCMTIQDKFGENSGRWCKHYNYNRKNQFVNRMERKGFLPLRVQIALTSRFVKINRFYTQVLLREPRWRVNRKNILKYEYLIKKLLQLFQRHDWARRFSAPKTKRKLEEYERIWALICRRFGWVYLDDLKKERVHRGIRCQAQ